MITECISAAAAAAASLARQAELPGLLQLISHANCSFGVDFEYDLCTWSRKDKAVYRLVDQ